MGFFTTARVRDAALNWHGLLLIPVVGVYLLLMALLLVYVLNYMYLAFVSMRARRRPAAPVLTAMAVWPRVTVQLPIYNELHVAARLLSAAAALDYPAGLLEIQVLDDSTDETAEVVTAAVDRLRSQGVDIVHLRRAGRDGFKAGALAAGLVDCQGGVRGHIRCGLPAAAGLPAQDDATLRRASRCLRPGALGTPQS